MYYTFLPTFIIRQKLIENIDDIIFIRFFLILKILNIFLKNTFLYLKNIYYIHLPTKITNLAKFSLEICQHKAPLI